MSGHGDDYLDNRCDLAAAIVRAAPGGGILVGGIRNPRTLREVTVKLRGVQLDSIDGLRDVIVDLVTAVLDEAQDRFRLVDRAPHDNRAGQYPPIDPDVVLGGRLKCEVRDAPPVDAGKRKRAV